MSGSEVSWDVFLSYARADDEAFVERLKNDLEAAGKRVWWDQDDMESRGRGFPLELRDAIWASKRVVAVIGPAALESQFVRFEWSYAYLCARAIVPILRKGTLKELRGETTPLLFRDEFEGLTEEMHPKDLAELHCFDFTRDDSYPKMLGKLLLKLEAEVPALAEIFGWDGRFPPQNYIPLPEIMRDISKALIFDVTEPVASPRGSRLAVICGQGGIGKSVMASAFAHAVKTRWTFLDGIFWVSLGPNPSDGRILKALRDIAERIDPERLESYTDRDVAGKNLKGALASKRCLLIADDAWEGADIREMAFALGPNCAMLATSRNKSLTQGIGGLRVSLDESPLTEEAALQLLGDWAGEELGQLPPRARDVVALCDGIPLALAICGNLIKGKRTSWSRLPALLEAARKRLLTSEVQDYDGEEINVFAPIEVSLAYLKELDKRDERAGRESLHRHESYLDLGILPVGTPAPDDVVSSLWYAREAMDEDLSLHLIGRLDTRGMLRFLGDYPLQKVRLPNLHRFFLASQLTVDEETELNATLGRALLSLWRTGRFPQGRPLNPTEVELLAQYCGRHLFRHLQKGRLWQELGELLRDSRFLGLKQEPAEQLDFEKEFRGLLDAAEAPIEEILEGIDGAIMTGMELSVAKADWLDTFAYWLGLKVEQCTGERQIRLEEIARGLDAACGVVAGDLTLKFLEQDEPDWAIRFAELRAWVAKRSGDTEALLRACDAGVEVCQQEGLREGYRTLGPVEFMRMRALGRNAAMKPGDTRSEARVAAEFDHLAGAFAAVGSRGWRLSQSEWIELDLPGARGFDLPRWRGKREARGFTANVVSNEHDAVAAMYLIQALEASGDSVNWIHHEAFDAGQLDPPSLRLTVLLGGPKAPGISSVSDRFYDAEPDAYLRMYSGLHCGPFTLSITNEANRSGVYLLGGVSKLHTLQAAYELAEGVLGGSIR